MSTNGERLTQASVWPLTTRDLLALLTALALALAIPASQLKSPAIAFAVFSITALPLLVVALATPAAWRILKTRADADGGPSADVGHERFAFKYGLLASVPYTTFWMMGILYPIAAADAAPKFLGSVYVLIGFIAALSCLPLLLALIYSLEAFWGARINLPLLVMRLAVLLMNLCLLIISIVCMVGMDY
jgi:hypothetical protein